MSRLLLSVFLLSLHLYGHQTGLSYINVVENDDVSVVYKKPLGDINTKGLDIYFPVFCAHKGKINKKIEDGFIIYKYKVTCTKQLEDSRIWIEGLQPLNRGVLFYYKDGTKKSTIKS